MEKLSISKRAAILRTLVEGASVASTSRITGANKRTVLNLIKTAGEACGDFMDRKMVNLPCKVLQLDEVWSFVGCKEKNKEGAIGAHPGDVWTWTCLCAETKLIPSWRVGDRSAETAYDFCRDLGKRFDGVIQISSDGLGHYKYAVPASFPDASFAQLIKIYGLDENGHDAVVGIQKRTVRGTPDADKINTSFVERSNLTVRMTNRRFTRKTNAFSKKLEAHTDMLAISFAAYNFTRKHMTLKTTPAVAAGVADKVMSMEEIVEECDAYDVRKLEEAYESAFSKLTPLRTEPRAYEPQKPMTPWYLDKDSGGPNPIYRKPGIKYQD
jgi:IS1 family transposase